MLTNARVNSYADNQDIGLSLLGAGIPLTAVKKPATAGMEVARRYQGRYSSTNDIRFELLFTNKFVTFAVSNLPNFWATLYPESATRFIPLEPGVAAAAVFVTNSVGRITGMTWTQNGLVTKLAREVESARLVAARERGDFVLRLEGDAQDLYALETSDDLADWRSVSTNSIWENPILRGAAEGNSSVFRTRMIDP